jgi:hypothetical protein
MKIHKPYINMVVFDFIRLQVRGECKCGWRGPWYECADQEMSFAGGEIQGDIPPQWEEVLEDCAHHWKREARRLLAQRRNRA